MNPIKCVAGLVLLTLLLAGCQKDELFTQTSTDPSLTSSEADAKSATSIPGFPGAGGFVAEVSNPYLSFHRGEVFRYESETPDGHETNLVEITQQNKMIMGVATTVVHDQVFADGALSEDTFDWYAQDKAGNVWYFGEDSRTIENGIVVSTEGSWEAGIDGQPGIIMLANPKMGLKYQQEDAPGIAEDFAKIHNLSSSIEVPFGTFTDCLATAESSLLEPGDHEFKYYKAGVGLLLEQQPKNGNIRNELVAVTN